MLVVILSLLFCCQLSSGGGGLQVGADNIFPHLVLPSNLDFKSEAVINGSFGPASLEKRAFSL